MYNGKSRYVYAMYKLNAIWDWIIQEKEKERKKKEKKRKEIKICIKSGLSQFLHVFPQQRM